MSLPKNKAWFAAKQYGYGWGFPSRWQGWLVFLLFISAITIGILFANSHPIFFMIYSLALTGVLVAICYWKGEEPRWRWGKENEEGLPDE